MSNAKNRLVIFVVSIATIVGMLACSGSTLLSRRTDPTATPTKTPKPTFTVTLTPTQTPIPTDTSVPTNTPTAEPPTNTPEMQTATFTPEPPTDTPTLEPLPTNTPVPPTKTPKPTAKPRPKATSTPKPPPKPTNTPAPTFPFRHVASQGWPNCGMTGAKVFFKHSDGSIYPGLQFAIYVAGGACIGVSNRANLADGSTDYPLNVRGPIAGLWEVRVVETSDGSAGADACAKIVEIMSPPARFETVTDPCDSDTSGVQVAWITFQEN
jgi:hypothetical protein